MNIALIVTLQVENTTIEKFKLGLGILLTTSTFCGHAKIFTGGVCGGICGATGRER